MPPSPAMMRSRVDLPQPLGPTSDTNWPDCTSNEMSSRATTPVEYVLFTRWIEMSGAAGTGAAVSTGGAKARAMGYWAVCSHGLHVLIGVMERLPTLSLSRETTCTTVTAIT